MAVTGILLGWKKNSRALLMPPTAKGEAVAMVAWLPLDSLSRLAERALLQQMRTHSTLDRMDIRPGKNIGKFLFEDRQLEVQLDMSTGKVLSVGRRHSDWIEQVHDGSIVDDWLGIPHGIFKVFYNSLMGVALIVFTVTGFWLWYGPKRMRRE